MSDVIPLAEPLLPPASATEVRDAVASTFIGPGARTGAFEETLAHVCGVSAAATTVSGTIALGVAARALGLRPGDEVIVPAYGVISVANGFAAEGFRVRPVDIDRATGLLDVDAVEQSLQSPASAVCLVDFSGNVGPGSTAIAQLARAHGALLIEDAACALGSHNGDLRAGTIGDVATTSFSVPKVVTTGQGGAILGSVAVVDRARTWIDQGDLEWRRTGLNREIGTNLRFSDLQAAVGQPQLDDLDARLERKRRVHGVLRDRLGVTLWTTPGATAPLHNVVFTLQPDALVTVLRQGGILAVCQYVTLTRHPAYAATTTASFPASDWWSDHAVYLPFGMALSEGDAERIAASVLASGVPLMDAPYDQGRL